MARPRPVEGSPLVGWEDILLYLEKRWGNSSGFNAHSFITDLDAHSVFFSLTLDPRTCLPAEVYLMAFDSRFSSIRLSNCRFAEEIKRFVFALQVQADVLFGGGRLKIFYNGLGENAAGSRFSRLSLCWLVSAFSTSSIWRISFSP